MKDNFYLIIFFLVVTFLFMNKPIFQDEELFVRIGQSIIEKGGEYYNFYGSKEKGLIHDSMYNPPLSCYIVALASLIIKDNIFFYHFIFMFPAIFLILGILKLAKISHIKEENCLYSALFAIATPAFMVCSFAVMSDIMMTALYTWAIYFWIIGEQKNKWKYYFISAFLISLSFLTKYFGITAIPLLMVFSIVQNKTFKKEIFVLLIPVAVLIFFEILTSYLYGNGLISKALLYPVKENSLSFRRIIVGLSFFGGCFFWLIIELKLIPVLISAIFVYFINIDDLFWIPISPIAKVQLIFFSSMGLSGLFFIGKKVIPKSIKNYEQRPYLVLFLLWIGGTWFFSSFINWTVNVRTMLPMIAPISIIFSEFYCVTIQKRKKLFLLFSSFIVSFFVQYADYEFAVSQKTAANIIIQKIGTKECYHQGGFSFNYIMEMSGSKKLDYNSPPILDKDTLLIIPENNCNVYWPGDMENYNIDIITIKMNIPVTIMSRQTGAGFHGSWGPLPFSFGIPPPNRFFIFQYKGEKSNTSS